MSQSPSGHTEFPGTTTSAKTITKRIPTWVPLAAFAGVSIGLAVPLFALIRQRQHVTRKALNNATAPTRRNGRTSAIGPIRKSTSVSGDDSSKAQFSSPGTGELLSAMSSADFGTAMYAGKAFAIATGIVTVFGVTLVFGVKSAMGVTDTADFAERMRMIVRRSLPGLTRQIHRPLNDDEGGGDSLTDSPTYDPNWKWEEAEKRLWAAYDKGSFSAWINTAMKEVDAEANLERSRRQKDPKQP